MFAVSPITNCPHVASQNLEDLSRFEPISSILYYIYHLIVDAPCYECKDNKENWICLKCAKIGCSSYQKGHMKQHALSEKHCLVLSFSDMSFWCYECDSYIANPEVLAVRKLFQKKKFPEPEPVGALADSLSELKIEPTEVINKTEEKPEKKEIEKPKLTLEEITKKLSKGEFKKIIVLTGAGISVNAGIPDFRSPGTGLYSKLDKYKLPFPEAVFALDYFKDNPDPFYQLACEMFGKKYLPTKTHYFIKLLQDKGLLIRNYTQNIDNLEADAGVKTELLVQAHGTYTTSHCIKCKTEVKQSDMMYAIKNAKPLYCEKCKLPCKPDIVFFGESLPAKFFANIEELRSSCDLLIIMGTSLVVMPFCALPMLVEPQVPRLVLNNELPDLFKESKNTEYVWMDGDCDKNIEKIVRMIGWDAEFNELMKIRDEEAKKCEKPMPEPLKN